MIADHCFLEEKYLFSTFETLDEEIAGPVSPKGVFEAIGL